MIIHHHTKVKPNVKSFLENIYVNLDLFLENRLLL